MPAGQRIHWQQVDMYWSERGKGKSIPAAAAVAGFGVSKANMLEKDRRARLPTDEKGRLRKTPNPLIFSELGPEAKRAREDFAYFQRRYFGRVPYPWQVKAAETVVELLSSPHKEYLVVNCPPGVGKTTLFTHDIPAWLTVRNRQLRGMMGHATTRWATTYVDRLRRTLSRTLPEKASDDDILAGLAFDAETTLAADFGRFQSIGDMWTRESFVVQQYEDMGAISEKEPTWSGFGQDASFIGGRFDFVIWDDLVDPKKQKTQEAKESLQDYWDTVSEPRLEPHGLLILQGQRLGSSDLYRYNLNKMIGEDIDNETGEVLGTSPKYHHILYKAHYEEKCLGAETHRWDAPGWPDGCLLSPARLPWKELATVKAHKNEHFEVVYQQQDIDPADVLVPPAWIYGHDGYPGCVDNGEKGTMARDRLELPVGLAGDLVSVMTVDPSPTKYWAIQWWVVQFQPPTVELRWLMDLERTPMDANEFLDFNHSTQTFTGLLEEWLQTSHAKGVPITHVIVEDNAAQRFLLQYDTVRRWMAMRGVEIIPHSTHRNKSDQEYGVDTIREHYKFGRVRLPFKRNSTGFNCSMKLITELTTYPKGTTDDCVMANWFLEWNLPRIYSPTEAEGRSWRPSWAASVPDLKRRPGVESGATAMMARASGAMR